MKEKKTEFRVELKKVKDEGKRSRLVKAGEELELLNTRALNKFSKSLDQLEKVLAGVKIRIDKKAEKGFDVSRARTAMEEAKTEIAVARAAIETQKAKTYKIEPASDADAKDALKKARKTLDADLKVVRGLVKKAREATHRVATTLAKVRKGGRVSPSPSASVSPSVSPSLSPSVSPSPSLSPSPTASPSPSPSPSATP
jgi:predicted  nucleic acid-binding Zn-ribbon protein